MNAIMFEGHSCSALLHFRFTRPVAAIRVGILTLVEKWEKHLGAKVSFLTQQYLSEKFPLKTAADNIFINGKFLPDKKLAESILKLKPGERLMSDGEVVAIRAAGKELKNISSAEKIPFRQIIEYKNSVTRLAHLCDIFAKN